MSKPKTSQSPTTAGLNPSRTEALLNRLTIVDKQSGGLNRCVLNGEQRQMLLDLWMFPFNFFLKVRQIGSTTLVIAWALIVVATNDALGTRYNAALVIDTDAKALERWELACNFADQMGLRYTKRADTPYLIRLKNGSRFVFMSAGGKRVGASTSYNLLILSELPFWSNVKGSLASLMATLLGNGRVVIETTMGVEDSTAKDLWLASGSAYNKRFFSFEDHVEYARPYDPVILPPELEEKLTKEGFTSREAMTDWAFKLTNQCGGDWYRCMREFPQRPEHSWTMAIGRFVRRTPDISDPKVRLKIDAPTSVPLELEIYTDPMDTSGQLAMMCDPSGGLGRDASALAVVDRRTEQIVGWVHSKEASLDDMEEAIRVAKRYFTTRRVSKRTGEERTFTPAVLIETNGVGRGLYQYASASGLRPVEIYTDRPSRYRAITLARQYVEAGVARGPATLSAECDLLTTKDGDFFGPKDGLMALGMCYSWMADNPLPPDDPVPVKRFQL